MIKQNFTKELQKDIAIHFGLLSIYVSLFLILLFTGIIFFIQNYQLSSETQLIQNEFQKTQLQSSNLLKELNKQIIPDYLKGGINDRRLFSEYYSKLSKTPYRSELLIADSRGNIQFTTDENWPDSLVTDNYLKSVIQVNKNNHSTTKITTNKNGLHYLIFFEKIVINNKNMGFSILFLNGNDFLQQKELNSTRYIIADKYDNVFTYSSNRFIKKPMEKVASTYFNKRFLYQNNHLIQIKNTSLTDSINLITYIIFLPTHIFLLLLTFSTLLVTIILMTQSYRLSKKIAKRNSLAINSLVEELYLIRSGYKMYISVRTKDEFGYLATQINQMIDKQNQLHKETLLLEKQSLQFEKKMLEAQFNPHFLFNTLETIRITISLQPKTAEELIHLLNKVLRYSLTDINEQTMLQEDISVIENYLKVNAIRFEKFNYQINVEPQLNNLVVPRLFLLPLIENALKYGMKTNGKLTIEIKCFKVEKYIIFEIIDNGPGFNEKARTLIQQQISNNQTQHGISNSYRRLEMYFNHIDLLINRVEGKTILQLIVWKEKENNVQCNNCRR